MSPVLPLSGVFQGIEKQLGNPIPRVLQMHPGVATATNSGMRCCRTPVGTDGRTGGQRRTDGAYLARGPPQVGVTPPHPQGWDFT